MSTAEKLTERHFHPRMVIMEVIIFSALFLIYI